MKVYVDIGTKVEVEIPDEFKTIDIPFDEHMNIKDNDIYVRCLMVAEAEVKKIVPNMNIYAVTSKETDNVMAEA